MTGPGKQERAPLGPTVAVATALALGAFLVVMPVLRLAIPATELPAPFPAQHQHAETLVFLLAYAVLLPLAALSARGLARRLGAGGAGALAALLAAAVIAVRLRGVAGAAVAGRSLKAPRPIGALVDALAIVALLGLVPDLVIFRPEAAGDPVAGYETGIIRFHHDFLLGPANEVLAGRPLLAGTASQYGVTSIYLLAGWFTVAPIGYGTLGLLTGAMTALWFAAGYAVLRLATVPRTLALAALGIAVVALAYNLAFPVGALPQSGPLRFGLPMGVVLAAVAAERRPARAGWAHAAGLGVLGLSSVWSLESFAFTAAVLGVLIAVRGWLHEGPGRGRWLVRQGALAVAACLTAHALFALSTLAASGALPDWGEYLAYLAEFLGGEVGDLTYDVERWTAGFVVGAGYLASGAALLEVLARRGTLVRRERPALIAIAGLTAYGVALLSYFVDRSLPHILVHIALPALLAATVWAALLLRRGTPATRRAAALAFGAVAALVLAVAWSSAAERFPRSALAHAAPGGRGLRDAVDRLWSPPPLDPAATAGEAALRRHLGGDGDALVIAAPDLGLEILMRAGRSDRLRLGDAWEASFAGPEELPGLDRAIADLRPGERMLLDGAARDVLAALRRDPSRDPLLEPVGQLALLQQHALREIDRRFELREVAPERDGFTVVELAARP